MSEITLAEAIESKRGLPYAQALAELRAETVEVIGRLTPDVVPELVEILSAGFRRRLKEFQFINDHPIPLDVQTFIYDSLQEAFDPSYLHSDRFVIHLGLGKHRACLEAAVLLDLITPEWSAEFIKLATYQKPKWPDIKMADVVAQLSPELMAGDWIDVGFVYSQRLQLTLAGALPEPSLIRIEMCESEDGTDWTKYKRVNHFAQVHEEGYYFAIIPNNGKQRRIRVRGEVYAFTGLVTAV